MAVDVLLINPPYRMNPPYTHDPSEMIDPPRNLGIIAAQLVQLDISVRIVDCPIMEYGFEDLDREIAESAPRIVGITNRAVSTFPMVERIAAQVKAHNRDIPVVCGGTYVSWMPREAVAKCHDIDYVVIGEGEAVVPELFGALLEGLDGKSIPGIAYFDHEKGEPVTTCAARIIEDLDAIPYPAYRLLPIERYVERGERYGLSLTRGCIFKCEYCTSSWVRGSVRKRSVANIMPEIRNAYEMGFRYFYFFDDIFPVDRQLVMDLCQAIVDSDMKFGWHCLSRTEYVDRELLDAMAGAGCDRIAYGVESGNESSLETLSRRVRKAEEAFSMTHQAGIRTVAFAIFGLPAEDFFDQLKTIRLLGRLRPSMVRDFTFKPYPGTPQYEHPENYDIEIFDWDYLRWTMHEVPVHRTSKISEDEIIEGRLLCSYLFRSKAKLQEGLRYRRRKGVQLIKGVSGGVLYNPHVDDARRKLDLYLNSMKIDDVYYEVLLHCDGYHNVQYIAKLIGKLFDLDYDRSVRRVTKILAHAVDNNMLEEMPLIVESPEFENARASVDCKDGMPAEDRILSLA